MFRWFCQSFIRLSVDVSLRGQTLSWVFPHFPQKGSVAATVSLPLPWDTPARCRGGTFGAPEAHRHGSLGMPELFLSHVVACPWCF